MTESKRGTELITVPINSIVPNPLQPRVNVSVDLVRRLSSSMQAGRHEPLLEVERIPADPERFQILCGEQRWRAAREAGMDEVLVRVHHRLGYLERLQKQYEENHLRADLDPVEEGFCILGVRTLKEVQAAEQLLGEALVPFQPLADKRVDRREQFAEHLEGLRRLLRKHRIDVDTLSPWSETEKALGISETRRKAKVGLLRLDPDLHDAVRELPAEHAIQISRLSDRRQQADLVARAGDLTHREVHAAVERLRAEPDLTVEQALAKDPEPAAEGLAFDEQLVVLGDLCRQIVRLILILRDDPDRLPAATSALADLRSAIDTLLEAA